MTDPETLTPEAKVRLVLARAVLAAGVPADRAAPLARELWAFVAGAAAAGDASPARSPAAPAPDPAPAPAIPPDDADRIAAHLAARGATRCPPAYVKAVQGATPLGPVPVAEEKPLADRVVAHLRRLPADVVGVTAQRLAVELGGNGDKRLSGRGVAGILRALRRQGRVESRVDPAGAMTWTLTAGERGGR